MDLKVHRTILYLALQRVKQRVDQTKCIISPDAILNKMFYPMWLGNWLTDMNQASAFFDVLEGKYRDPYTRWKGTGDYDFPEAIRNYPTEWVNMFNSLWKEECKSVGRFNAFSQITIPAGTSVSDPNQIGGYYPYDHFDVADRLRPLCPQCRRPMTMTDDQKQWSCVEPKHSKLQVGDKDDVTWESVPDAAEYENAKDLLSQTICRAVFNECLWGPLHVALIGKRDNTDTLRALGKALHILQDFYAHSNFVELLFLCADAQKKLPQALSEALARECVGPFASFVRNESLTDATVVTGRFDQVDTVASILKIYRENLVTRLDDLDAGGYHGEKGKTRDLMVEVLFGTFSNQPFVPMSLLAVKKAYQVTDFLSEVGDRVTRGVIAFFGWVAKSLNDKDAEESIDKVQNLLLASNDVQAKDYATAGRIMYVERVIAKNFEDKLRSDRKKLGHKVLPHHTLLAKDQDVSQPECRLGFKIAALLAVDLTAQILEQYLTGGDRKSMESVLRAHIVHPATLLKSPTTLSAFNEVVKKVYGERWWQVGNVQTDLILS